MRCHRPRDRRYQYEPFIEPGMLSPSTGSMLIPRAIRDEAYTLAALVTAPTRDTSAQGSAVER